MDEPELQNESVWLDHLFNNLSSHLETLILIQKATKDHQTRLQITTQIRALSLDLQEIKQRNDSLYQK